MESFSTSGKFRRRHTISGSLLFDEQGKRHTDLAGSEPHLPLPGSVSSSKPDPLAAGNQGEQGEQGVL